MPGIVKSNSVPKSSTLEDASFSCICRLAENLQEILSPTNSIDDIPEKCILEA